MGNCHMASSSEAVVVSGGCCIPRHQKHKAVVGNWKCLWAWAYLSKVDRLSLDVLTYKQVYKNVKTARGAPVTVSIVAEVQVMQDLLHFARASDYFLGKDKDEMADLILPVLEAHLRNIFELLTTINIEEDSGHFAARVQKAATPDFWEIGVLIHNFIITDVVREEKPKDQFNRNATRVKAI